MYEDFLVIMPSKLHRHCINNDSIFSEDQIKVLAISTIKANCVVNNAFSKASGFRI